MASVRLTVLLVDVLLTVAVAASSRLRELGDAGSRRLGADAVIRATQGIPPHVRNRGVRHARSGRPSQPVVPRLGMRRSRSREHETNDGRHR